MRWVLWGDGSVEGGGSDPSASGTSEVPSAVLDEMMRFIRGGLGSPAAGQKEEAGR
jgi:hypothetical protein